MCRLFGFKSRILSQVHKSLIDADNALMHQSPRHPDGWGVAYYVNGCPQIVRSLSAAINDELFEKVSGIVSSQAVLAHLRKATIGSLNILNTHPFQHGKWTFAHNGNIKDFDSHRPEFLAKISPTLKPFLLGTTDSEIIFFLILSQMKLADLNHVETIEFSELESACRKAISIITDICGPMHPHDDGRPTETFLTFILSDGKSMIAHQGGKKLLFSTYKSKCSDRKTCKYFGPSCENKVEKGSVNHLILSSEKLAGENIWEEIPFGKIIGVDHDLKLWKDF